MTRDVFDRYADSYSEQIDNSLSKFGVDHDFFTRHKAWLIGEVLRRDGRNPGRLGVLDVGCGVGVLHGLLIPLFESVAGTDVSAESIRVAVAANPQANYKVHEGTALPFDDASFDVALAVCVFHHVPPAQWQSLAAEMLRVVRGDGLVMVIEHNPYNPVTRHIVRTSPLDEGAVLLSPRKLRSVFEAAGAADIVTRTVLNIPPRSSLLRTLDLALGRVPVGAQYYLTAEKPLAAVP